MRNRLRSRALLYAAALALGLAAGPLAAQQTPAPAQDEALRAELVELGRRDQEARRASDPSMWSNAEFLARMLRVDSANTRRLREIVRERGWPRAAVTGADGARAAFLVVQHSPDRAFRKEMLELLRALPAAEVRRSDLAALIDRVAVEEGKPQVYGTQFNLMGGKATPLPMEDPERVDERRASMGLPPMAEYARMLEQAYTRQTQAAQPPPSRDSAAAKP